MSSIVDEIVKGRKTFFIAPDKSLFPEAYLEEFLTLGYECYFIDTDIFLPISIKIDIILSIFKDSIIFFNIDGPIQNDTWANLIHKASVKYPEALFGVMYAKRLIAGEKEKLEKYYLFNLGCKCGCVQLEYQKKNNFTIIQKALYANQAMGRRKNVRAVCTSSCSVKFVGSDSKMHSVKLNDVSISHFSITVHPEDEVEFKDYEKIIDAQFYIKGLHFRSDAVLFMSRPIENGILYIFAFTSEDGQIGLEKINRQLIIPKIYGIMVDNCQDLLGRLFKTALEQREPPHLEL